MQELADVLDRERRLLEMVLFKLVEARHLLTADEARFLPWASAELERAVERVREATLLRAVVARQAASAAGLEEAAGLRALAARSEQPWSAILGEQAEALAGLLREIREESARAQAVADSQIRGVDAVVAAMASLAEGAA